MSNDVLGESTKAYLGPINMYLDDDDVSEVMVNGPDRIYFEKGGKLHKAETTFPSEEALMAAVRNIAQYMGRVISEDRPTLDARLPDGSRIHIVVPPCARFGAYIAIRKFFKESLTIKQLVGFGSMNVDCAKFLNLCIQLKKNIVVSGGTSSGKTTLLNVVSSLIPNNERIIIIEDSSELQLQQDHIVPMETKAPDKNGEGAVPIRELVKSSLRMRPDRVIIGEIRGGEALDLLQAMNTGHSGSMTTVHANDPRQTMSRLETLALMAGVDLPHLAIKNQIASAIDLVVQASRLRDGSRKVTHISEIVELDLNGHYVINDIFLNKIISANEDGKLNCKHIATGKMPSFYEEAKAQGFKISKDWFKAEE
ncbi:MAG: CpaF family protein [Pseudomonadota bacterium]